MLLFLFYMYFKTHVSLAKDNMEAFITKALTWADSFPNFAYYTSNNIEVLHGGFTHILCIDAIDTIQTENNSLAHLSSFIKTHPYWLCGYFSYNLKNEIEKLEATTSATIPFHHLAFFQPRYLIFFNSDSLEIHSWQDETNQVFENIKNTTTTKTQTSNSINIIPSVSKPEYYKQVQRIKQLIVDGEFYELNYCIEFNAQVDSLDYIGTFQALNTKSPMPFACLFKMPEGIAICASPERFLKKAGSHLIAQPIKGTIARSTDKTVDEANKKQLKESDKERAENMMIVDLTRSDLAKCSKIGSIKVEEMFGIYSFMQVHQMISTVAAEVKAEAQVSDLIKATFPMGSMTGAPKVRAMQYIDQIEATNRGLYSGALGLIAPNGDFDFNVVIRTIIYAPDLQKLSFHVGSAITTDSNAEKEYEECLLKAKAIFQVLGVDGF